MRRFSSQSGYKDLRAGRVSQPDRIYLVTTVVRGRRPLFADWSAARCVAQVLADRELWRPHQCLAWVLMPDHWHGLIQLGLDGDLSTAMHKAKGRSARSCDTSGGLWQKGFHDRAIRCQQDVRRAARYIVANPLRAGLVEDVLQYPFWDAIWMGDGAWPA